MAVGYGVSVWCTDSVRTGRYARGVTAVAQSLYRRFTTPRGTLRGPEDGSGEEATFGLDLAGLVGSLAADQLPRVLPAMIEAEASKDERIASTDVALTVAVGSDGLAEVTIAITCQLHDSAESFTLTLTASAAAVVFNGIAV